jgi:lipopolysaccharide transport system ATP-binding protein
MGAVRQLCSRVVHLGKGKVVSDVEDVMQGTNAYLHAQQAQAKPRAFWTNPGNANTNRWFVPLKFGLSDREGRALSGTIDRQEDAWVYIEGFVKNPNPALAVGYGLYSDEGVLLYYSLQSDLRNSENMSELLKEKIFLRSKFPNNFLNNGTYSLELTASLYKQEWINQPGVNSPSVLFKLEGSLSSSPYWTENRGGVLAPLIAWEHC